MKRIYLTLLFACVCAASVWAAKVNKSVTLDVKGQSRTYCLYVPDNVKANAPLVLALHGAGGHSTDHQPGFDGVADKEGFIVAYPQGNNVKVYFGDVPGWLASGAENDDVDFIRAIIEDVDKSYSLDRKRIYCCGFSMGGMMTYALSNTCSDIIAAFASISGFPMNENHLRHTGARPVPFLHIHGKADDFVKYSLMPIIVDEMVARLGANPVPKKTTVSGRYDKSVYEAGEGGFPYVYYEMDGMGHSPYTDRTPEGNSSQTMWNFFKQYTLDSPCNKELKWMPRIETEGYQANKHGWSMNLATTLLRFGMEQKSDANQNVYRSLQLDNGCYKLCFKSSGAEGKTINVAIKKLSGKKNSVLKADVKVGEVVSLPFEVTDGWGEYSLVLTRESASDNITVTDLALYTATEEEVGVPAARLTPDGIEVVYTLAGVRNNSLQKGVQIVKTASGNAKKTFVR